MSQKPELEQSEPAASLTSEVHDPVASPASELLELVNGAPGVDLPLLQLVDLVPPPDLPPHVHLAERFPVVGEEMRFAGLHDDHLEQFPPVVADNVRHSSIHRLEGRISDDEHFLPFLLQSEEVRYQLWVSVQILVRVRSCLLVESLVSHTCQ